MSFIYKFVTFFAVFALLLYLAAGIIEFGLDKYKDSDISILHEMRDNREYGIILMGTSHARMFGVSGHKKQVEQILGEKIFMLANNGSGILPQKIYLELFYEKGNKAKEILYFIDPWVLYSPTWNEKNYYIADEVFRLGYLKKLVYYKFDTAVVREYIRKKISYKLFVYPIPRKNVFYKAITEKELQNLDKDMQERFELWYPHGIEGVDFAKYSSELERLIILAQSNDVQITFIMPPALFEDQPGKSELIKLMREYEKEYKVKFYDYSNSLKDSSMYLNMDHLNEKGVMHFSRSFLVPILSK